MVDILEEEREDGSAVPADDRGLSPRDLEELPSQTVAADSVLPSEKQAPDEDVLDSYGYVSDDIVDLYLREMARVPLLTVEEEVELAANMRKGREAERDLCAGEQDPEQRERLREAIQAGLAARERLVRANTRLVVSIAKKYVGRGVPFLDLIQEGNIGLMKAIERFDHTRGFRLSTYATWWIRQTVTRAIADQGRTIRVPVHMGDQIRRLYRVAQQIQQRRGCAPTPEELAAETGLDPSRVRWMLGISRRATSLQRLVGEDQDTELGALIEDENSPSPDETAFQSVLRDDIDKVLNTLPPREARIVRLRFGLQDGKTYTLEQIGEQFGLTRERIRQLLVSALNRLRHPRRSRQLRDYMR